MGARGKYKIVVREPSWQNSTTLWEEFELPAEAEEFIKEVAPTYPEGTLLFIAGTWAGKHPLPFTIKAFIVNSYGEATKRRRNWVPDNYIPVEWAKGASEEITTVDDLIEDYSKSNLEEKLRLDSVMRKMGVDPLSFPRKARGYIKPSDLEGNWRDK